MRGKKSAGNEKIGSTNYITLYTSCVHGRTYVISDISTGEQIKSVYYVL